MKTIKGFEGEEIAVSDFGEWVGKDYIDYKFEYKNNQKVIKELFKENQDLKKQLEEINNFINKADFANIEQLMLDYCAKTEEQKEFMEYLEDKLAIINNVLDTEKDEDKVYFTLIRKDVVEETLLKYKEIIGGKYEGNKNL